MQGGGGSRSSGKPDATASRPAKYGTGSAGGFTMAEILLSLTIIGVVAAITLPSLTGNINERTWNTQRKALYARMSQAVSLMPAQNGFGTTENYVTSGLAKVLKINNICEKDKLTDCGLPAKMVALTGSVFQVSDIDTLFSLNSGFSSAFLYSGINTNAVGFETQNRESIIAYYNPKCTDFQYFNGFDMPMARVMCANFIYDLNSSKGPNTMGKDIGFISVFYTTDSSVVAPIPLKQDVSGIQAWGGVKECRALDPDSTSPQHEELYSMYYNNILLGITGRRYSADIYRSDFDSGNAWTKGINFNISGLCRCIKR